MNRAATRQLRRFSEAFESRKQLARQRRNPASLAAHTTFLVLAILVALATACAFPHQSFASSLTTGSLAAITQSPSEAEQQTMHRLYNPNSGEHFYTASTAERDNLVHVGWNYEGVGWIAPSTSNAPVYRLYSGTDHHYTMSVSERDWLLLMGWKDEGVGWYSDERQHVPLYRQYNPNVKPSAPRNNSGSHNYTTSKAENDNLVKAGWRAESIGWYAIEADHNWVFREAWDESTPEIVTGNGFYFNNGRCAVINELPQVLLVGNTAREDGTLYLNHDDVGTCTYLVYQDGTKKLLTLEPSTAERWVLPDSVFESMYACVLEKHPNAERWWVWYDITSGSIPRPSRATYVDADGITRYEYAPKNDRTVLIEHGMSGTEADEFLDKLQHLIKTSEHVGNWGNGNSITVGTGNMIKIHHDAGSYCSSCGVAKGDTI